MWSSALDRSSPTIRWLPVAHIKGCLGLLIMSAIHGIYLRFGLIHASLHAVPTALGRSALTITKNSLILVDLIGFCSVRDCGTRVSAVCPALEWVKM